MQVNTSKMIYRCKKWSTTSDRAFQVCFARVGIVDLLPRLLNTFFGIENGVEARVIAEIGRDFVSNTGVFAIRPQGPTIDDPQTLNGLEEELQKKFNADEFVGDAEVLERWLTI